MLVLRLDAALRSREPAAAAAELVRLLSDPCSPPALVNNCAIKLADAFGHGDRSRRAVIAGCLRRACFRPSRVLNRALVVERIGSVLAEDDPAARVLALQALRCILPLLLDHLEALQCVGRCLRSTDEAECAAAASALGAACEAGSACAHTVLTAHLLPALGSAKLVAGGAVAPPPAPPLHLLALLRHHRHTLAAARSAFDACAAALRSREAERGGGCGCGCGVVQGGGGAAESVAWLRGAAAVAAPHAELWGARASLLARRVAAAPSCQEVCEAAGLAAATATLLRPTEAGHLASALLGYISLPISLPTSLPTASAGAGGSVCDAAAAATVGCLSALLRCAALRPAVAHALGGGGGGGGGGGACAVVHGLQPWRRRGVAARQVATACAQLLRIQAAGGAEEWGPGCAAEAALDMLLGAVAGRGSVGAAPPTAAVPAGRPPTAKRKREEGELVGGGDGGGSDGGGGGEWRGAAARGLAATLADAATPRHAARCAVRSVVAALLGSLLRTAREAEHGGGGGGGGGGEGEGEGGAAGGEGGGAGGDVAHAATLAGLVCAVGERRPELVRGRDAGLRAALLVAGRQRDLAVVGPLLRLRAARGAMGGVAAAAAATVRTPEGGAMDKGDDVAAAAAVVAAVAAAAAEAEAVEPAEAAEGMEDVEDEHGAASDGGVRAAGAAEAAEAASASVAACSLLGAGGGAWAAYEIAREALVGGWPASALAVLTALLRRGGLGWRSEAWLEGLQLLAAAEAAAQQGGVAACGRVHARLCLAARSLEIACSPQLGAGDRGSRGGAVWVWSGPPGSFQLALLRLRARHVQRLQLAASAAAPETAAGAAAAAAGAAAGAAAAAEAVRWRDLGEGYTSLTRWVTRRRDLSAQACAPLQVQADRCAAVAALLAPLRAEGAAGRAPLPADTAASLERLARAPLAPPRAFFCVTPPPRLALAAEALSGESASALVLFPTHAAASVADAASAAVPPPAATLQEGAALVLR